MCLVIWYVENNPIDNFESTINTQYLNGKNFRDREQSTSLEFCATSSHMQLCFPRNVAALCFLHWSGSIYWKKECSCVNESAKEMMVTKSHLLIMNWRDNRDISSMHLTSCYLLYNNPTRLSGVFSSHAMSSWPWSDSTQFTRLYTMQSNAVLFSTLPVSYFYFFWRVYVFSAA